MKISKTFTIRVMTQAINRILVITLGYLLPALSDIWLSMKRLRGETHGHKILQNKHHYGGKFAHNAGIILS